MISTYKITEKWFLKCTINANLAYNVVTAFNADVKITLMVTITGTSFANSGSNQVATVTTVPSGSETTGAQLVILQFGLFPQVQHCT